MQISFQSLRTALLLLLTFLVLSCSRTWPGNSENAARSEVHAASAASAPRTIKVLQYNVKQGNKKKAQTCCWFDPSIRAKEQAVIVEEMANQGVELASLIESDNIENDKKLGQIYNCSSLDDVIGNSVPSLLKSLASQCSLRSANGTSAGTFKEALHLVWNTKTYIRRIRPLQKATKGPVDRPFEPVV
jgi:hypothetical protein